MPRMRRRCGEDDGLLWVVEEGILAGPNIFTGTQPRRYSQHGSYRYECSRRVAEPQNKDTPSEKNKKPYVMELLNDTWYPGIVW